MNCFFSIEKGVKPNNLLPRQVDSLSDYIKSFQAASHTFAWQSNGPQEQHKLGLVRLCSFLLNNFVIFLFFGMIVH